VLIGASKKKYLNIHHSVWTCYGEKRLLGNKNSQKKTKQYKYAMREEEWIVI
jgi:hypothetical protein